MEPICSPNVRGYGQFCSVSGILIERVTEEAAPARGHAGAPGVNVAEWAARDVHDRVDVREVDDLGYVGEGEPGRLRVPVHRDDAEAPLARLRDRAALVASRADEEDARHRAIVDARSRKRGCACRAIGTNAARSRVPLVCVVSLGFEPWGGGRRPESDGVRHGTL